MSPLTELRARVVLAEAQALGVGLADLVAAAGTLPPPSLGEVIDTLAPAFTRATVATYRPYWRLAVELHGTAPITSLTVGHLQEVVDAIHQTRHDHIKLATVGNPSIPEFVEMIADTGAGMHACTASVELFGLEKNDFIPQIQDIITVGEFYEIAAGGQIIFT